MRFRSHLPVDPDCPDVRRFHESHDDDPISQSCGCLDEITEAFEARHRVTCERCRDYGLANIEVVD